MASSPSPSMSLFLFFSVALFNFSLPTEARKDISHKEISRIAAAPAAEFSISGPVADVSDHAFAPLGSYTADGPSKATASPSEFTVSKNTGTDDAFAPATSPGSHNSLFAADSDTTGTPSAGAADSSISAFEMEATDASSTSSWATSRSRRITTPRAANAYYDEYDGKSNLYRSQYGNEGEINGAKDTQSRVNNYNNNYGYTKSDSRSTTQNAPNYVAEYYGKIEFVDPNLA